MMATLQKYGISSSFLTEKVTLRRLGAPLLYAYDAHSFARRLRGIHGVPTLGATDALIIRPCRAIHTFGVKQTIDVVFMNRYGVILKMQSVKPCEVMTCWNAVVALEMAEGTAARIGLGLGQTLVPSQGRW